MRVTLVCTNDIHSRCDQFSILSEEISKICSSSSGSALHVDAGDWFSGTVYSTLGPRLDTPFPEVEFFRKNKSVAAIGNHEFDCTVEGFHRMMEKAMSLGYQGFTCCNMVLTNPKSYFTKDVLNVATVNPVVIRKVDNGAVVGCIGLMGPDAIYACAESIAGSDLKFLSWVESKKVAVQLASDIRNSVDFVILLLHGGKEELETSFMKEFDFIVTGHTHEKYPADKDEKCSQAGCYGTSLGVHVLTKETRTSPCEIEESSIKALPLGKNKHFMYESVVQPLLREQFGHETDFSRPLNLPKKAQLPIQRGSLDCDFSTWVCDSILQELNASLKASLIHGFFLPNELIRRDFRKMDTVTFSDIVECVEVGQAQPNAMGIDLVTIETSWVHIQALHLVLRLAAKFITENAMPSYSTGFLTPPKMKTVRITTTSVVAKYLQKQLPWFIFDANRVVHTERVALSWLLYQYLRQSNIHNCCK